jgi:hypothetical protein
MLDTTTVSIPFWSGRFRFTSILEDVDTREIFICTIYVFKITENF